MYTPGATEHLNSDDGPIKEILKTTAHGVGKAHNTWRMSCNVSKENREQVSHWTNNSVCFRLLFKECAIADKPLLLGIIVSDTEIKTHYFSYLI